MRSPAQISDVMRRVRSRDTSPEVALRSAVWRRGLRFQVARLDLPGKPDIVFPRARVIVFVDGDFWHGGQWTQRNLQRLEDQFSTTLTRDYWLKKIRRNMHRDCTQTAELLAAGWTVLRYWESDVKRSLEDCVATIESVVRNGAIPTPRGILPRKTFAEFFAGIGLMRMGLERQGWSARFANDLDPDKREMYFAQFPGSDAHWNPEDVHLLDPAEVPDVTLATASFPCNDLSLAGARGGLKGDQSSAFWGFVRVLEGLADRRPYLVLLENVPGFLTSNRGQDFREALTALNRLGYSVDAFQLDAADFVPQSRQRLFVVGVLAEDDTYPIGPPNNSHRAVYDAKNPVRPAALLEFVQRHPEIRWHVRTLPVPPKRTFRLEDILDDLPEDAPEWWSQQRSDYLLNQMSARHREIADCMIASNQDSYGTVFRRIRKKKSMAELRTDGIAGCLRTPRGGSGRQILIRGGRGVFRARLITPRECARLMGANDFRLTVPSNQALFGFGDAVCVPVIEWIAQYYLNPLVNERIHGKQMRLALELAERRGLAND